jgi:hypothetical protein
MLDICEAPKPVAYTKGLQYVLAQNVGHLWGTKPVAYTKGLQYVLAQNVGHLWDTKTSCVYERTPICISVAQDVGHLWDGSKDHNFRACFASLILCHVVDILQSYVSGLVVLFRHISGLFIRCNKDAICWFHLYAQDVNRLWKKSPWLRLRTGPPSSLNPRKST